MEFVPNKNLSRDAVNRDASLLEFEITDLEYHGFYMMNFVDTIELTITEPYVMLILHGKAYPDHDNHVFTTIPAEPTNGVAKYTLTSDPTANVNYVGITSIHPKRYQPWASSAPGPIIHVSVSLKPSI